MKKVNYFFPKKIKKKINRETKKEWNETENVLLEFRSFSLERDPQSQMGVINRVYVAGAR